MHMFRDLTFEAPAPLRAGLPLLLLTACAYAPQEGAESLAQTLTPPVPGAVLVNELIEEGESHFKNLWQVTFEGQNAEAYWSFADDRLSLQISGGDIECDRIFVTGRDGYLRQVSDGRGVTTCAFFMPGDKEVLYASTQSAHVGCPERERSRSGEYTWPLWPDYDIYVSDLASTDERMIVGGYGYDAEATVSPRGDRIVYTSTRSGDLELWTCDMDGSNPFQVTDDLGYDGGAFFSHDGRDLVFRATAWTPGSEAEEQESYREDLLAWKVRPNKMEIFTIGADGKNRQQITTLGGANFAPYFTPDDQRVIFSSNHHNSKGKVGLNFDLFMVDRDGGNLEQVTTFDGAPGKQFDAFPMFSHDGRYLAFSSNRGPGPKGDTNVFVAEWVDQP